MLEALKRNVCEANLALVRAGLVTLTWGNASGLDPRRRLVVIKPSGVDYAKMKPADMVVVDLDGRLVEGRLRPSSDLPSHLVLYRAWPRIGGIVHTHAAHATTFAQAGRDIPCLGTTHADHFHGAVPLTRPLPAREVRDDYEAATGRVIVERFAALDPVAVPGVLVANHGPFTWGRDVADAVRNAIALEAVARLAAATFALNPKARPLARHLLDKHYRRKHGPDAYYGQKRPK
jgi:L-ribulose-5-phosphate 4-epimerase